MRRAGYLLAIVLPLFAQTSVAAQGLPGPNLLVNASFSRDLAGWQVSEDYRWEQAGGDGVGGAISVSAPRPPDDQYIHKSVATQCVRLDGGERFTLEGMVKLDGMPLKPSANRVNLYWYTSDDCSKGGQYGTYLQPRGIPGWQYDRSPDLKPILGARSARIEIVQRGRFSDGGRAHWDALSLKVIETVITELPPAFEEMDKYTRPPGQNYLSNGQFDENIALWRQGWDLAWSGRGLDGPGAMKITATSSGGSIGKLGASQCANLGTNKLFEMGASFRRDPQSTQDGGARLRIVWYGELNCRGRVRIGDHDDPGRSSDRWQIMLIKNMTPPPSTLSARVELIQSVAGEGSFSAYWDDVFLRASE